MATKIHEGMKYAGHGLTAPAIATKMIDQIIKGDDDSIEICELVSHCSDTRENVLAAINLLVDKGNLRITGADLEDAGSFRIKNWRIDIEVDQRTLPYNKPTTPNVETEAFARREEGYDSVVRGSQQFDGHVEYNGEWSPGGYELTINTMVIGEQFKSMEDAWRHFDNYVQREARQTTLSQTYTNAVETVWTAEIGVIHDAFTLKIHRKAQEDATSMLVVDEAFDTQTEAWTFVDEYLNSPGVLDVAEEETSVEEAPAKTGKRGK